jgi:pyruvate/2-oxoglutarate dehydrogenase complex dihydrolipoamide acyltransferase (E2) component
VRQNLAMASSDPSSDRGEREVFAGLPNARPHRRSAKRDRPVRAADTPAPAKAKSKAKSKPAAKTSAKPKAKKAARPAAAPRAAASKIPPAGYATPRDDDALKGTDLITTAVQAAGELAQIGIGASGRALKSALHRLPRP